LMVSQRNWRRTSALAADRSRNLGPLPNLWGIRRFP
jgi:hypothetical protein